MVIIVENARVTLEAPLILMDGDTEPEIDGP